MTIDLLGIFELSGTIKEESDRYYKACKPLLDGGRGLINTAHVMGYAFSFAQVCSGVAAITNVAVGYEAQRALQEIHSKVANDVSNISKNLDISITNQYQKDFGQHVFDFWNMQSQSLETDEQDTGRKHFIFIYNRGNDWHGTFHRLLNQGIQSAQRSSSISVRSIGIFDNLDTLGAMMRLVRKAVGKEPTFHILLPAADVTVIKKPFAFPQDVEPLVFVGEKHTATGKPYCYLNMPRASKTMFRDVYNLAEDVPSKSGPSISDHSLLCKTVKITAEVTAGVPAGWVGMMGGAAGSALIMGAAVSVCPPLLPVAPLIMGAGSIGGAGVAGTMAARRAGNATEALFKRME